MDKIIIGAGGFAEELSVLTGIKKCYVSDGFDGKYFLSNIKKPCKAIIAIAFPKYRENIFNEYDFEYFGYIHNSALVYGTVPLSDIILAPQSIITTNVKIGKQCQLHTRAVLSHSVEVGDFFTALPNVFVAGNVIIGDRVFIGAGTSVREKTKICSDVIIGMGSVVIKDITEQGTYIGNPLRKIK